MWRSLPRWVDFVWLAIISLLSFFYFALPFYPFLNSDIAIQVYMTESFSIKSDLYFWGQNRLGSAVPLLGHILYKLLSVPPIWAVSIAKWCVLTLGGIVWFRFFKLRWQRWVFIILWFFPAYEMTYFLLPGHPYGEQMTFVGLSLYFLRKYIQTTEVKALFWLVVCAWVSIWISDFSILFFLTIPIFFFRETLAAVKRIWANKRSLVLLAPPSLVGLFVIFYAKTSSAGDPRYIHQLFASTDELLHTLDLLWFYTYNSLIFESISVWNSIMLYALIGASLLTLPRLKLEQNSWPLYFIGTAVLGLVLLCCLRWVSVNYVMIKYFIPVILLYWIGLITASSEWLGLKRVSVNALLALSVLSANMTTPSIHQEKKEPYIPYQTIKPLQDWGRMGIIGDYWTSYVLGIPNPSEILTSPLNPFASRHPGMRAQIAQLDSVYVNTPALFEKQPETILFEGSTFLRSNRTRRVHDFELTVYHKKQ